MKLIALLLGLLQISPNAIAATADPVIWGARDTPMTLINALCLGEYGSCFFSGSVNPTITATFGTIGSLYLSTSGSVYIKGDNGTTTNWSIVGAGGSGGSVTGNSHTTAGNIVLWNSAVGTVIGNSPISVNGSTGNLVDPGTITASNFNGTFSGTSSGTNTGDVTIGTAHGLSLSGQVLSLGLATSVASGALSNGDWSTFNNKQNALSFGDVTATSPISVTGGTNAIIGSGVNVSMTQAGSSSSGWLSATDWNTFNGNQPAGNYITALTGDVSATGPGSATATVNAVGGSTAANIHTAEQEVNSISYSGWSIRFGATVSLADLKATLDYIMDMGYIAPTIVLATVPAPAYRELGNTISSVQLNATVTQTADPISSTTFFSAAAGLIDTDSSTGSGIRSYTDGTGFASNYSYYAKTYDGVTTVTSNTVSFPFGYVYLYGLAPAQGENGSWIYSNLTHGLFAQQASVNFTSSPSAELFYFCQPSSYAPITKIYDPNNFNIFADFTEYTGISVTNAYSQTTNYDCWEYNNPTTQTSFKTTYVQ